MPNDIDAGRIVASIVLDTQQARAEADTVEYIADVLEQMGIKGAEATRLIKSCFSDTSALKQYQSNIEILASKLDAQREKIEQLKSAKEQYEKSGYYDKASQNADSIQKETIRLMELEAQFDKAFTAQDNYIKKTVTSYQKQGELNDALDNKQAGKNFAQGVNLATTSLRTLDSIAPDAVSSVGEIITQINSAKQAMTIGASAPLAWGTAIVAGIGVVTNLVVNEIQKAQQAEEQARQKATEVAAESKEACEELTELSDKYVLLKTKLDTANLSHSDEIQLKSNLLEMQKQLVEKYGDEAKSIDLVSGSLSKQREEIRKLRKEKANQYLIDNESDYDKAVQKMQETSTYSIALPWQKPIGIGGFGLSAEFNTKLRNPEVNKIIAQKFPDAFALPDQELKIDISNEEAVSKLREVKNEIKALKDAGYDVQADLDLIESSLAAASEKNKNELSEYSSIIDAYEKQKEIFENNGEEKKTEAEKEIERQQELISTLSEYKYSMSGLADVYKTVSDGGKLNSESLSELVEKYPLLAEYINETGDVSLASGEKIKEAYEEQRKAMISTLTEQKEGYEKQLDELQAKRQAALNDGVTDEAAAEYGELSAQYNEVSKNLSTVNAQLDLYNSELETAETQDITATINQQRASLENLAAAYKSLSSGQQLSTDAVLSLTKAYPQLADYINATGDLTFANGEKIKQAYQAEYDAMIKNLETKKQQLEALGNESDELQEVNTQLAVYKACLSSIDEAPSFTDISGDLKSLAAAYRELSDSKQLDVDTMISMIDKYPEVASAIANEGSLTKDQANIFKTLFEAKKNDYILTQQKAADNLKASLAETEGVIANIKAQIEAYKQLDLIMGAIATAGLTIAMKMNKEQAGNIKKEIEKIEARIKAVQSIGADTYGKSDSKSGNKSGNKDTSNKALAEELKQLDHKKSLGKLTAKQEYDWLVKINNKYRKNADEKMDMEKRLYNAKKAWQDDVEASRKAKLQKEYDDIDHKKAMGKMNTAQEIARLKKIRDTFELNADEIKDLNEKIYALEKQAQSETLQAAYDGIEHKKALGQMTAKEELAQLEKIRDTYKMTAEERIELEIKIYNLKKDLQQDEIDSLNNLADAITEALKNKYEEQRKIEEERINESIKNWQTWEDETVAAIQGQIDALDELAEADDREAKRQEYENKRQQLEMQLAYEKDDYNRKSIEKELAKLDADEAKRIAELEREDMKKSYEEQIENVRKESEQQQKARQELLEENNKKYDELTSDASLKAQTSKILMNSGQKDIVNLIKGYAPDYDLAGQTIGESLYNGFKSKVGNIESYIDGITNKLTSYQNQLAKTANTAADKFWTTRKSYQKQIDASKAPASVSVNQTVNFNQPVTTPVQTKRQLNTVSQALAQQIVNGY